MLFISIKNGVFRSSSIDDLIIARLKKAHLVEVVNVGTRFSFVSFALGIVSIV